MIELSIPNFQITTSNRNARQTSSSLSDRQYLEVVDDKDHSLPLPIDNEQQSHICENSFSSKEESFNVNSYEGTEKHATSMLNSIPLLNNITNDNSFKSIRTLPIDRSTSSKSGESTSSEESEVVTLKKNIEYLNPYAFLNTNDVDFGHSYCTLITSAPAKGFENSVKLSLKQKRHSYP
ncbi:unnamed protein product [Mytilus coruscus]|uniref:Uncharacterized protein n=1 Tax=Mytilus coruscus TaxID=42192 RepID=A0A6J8BMJ2_MYTCO|nr:unnamed protein product [Mytilus coruscus]